MAESLASLYQTLADIHRKIDKHHAEGYSIDTPEDENDESENGPRVKQRLLDMMKQPDFTVKLEHGNWLLSLRTTAKFTSRKKVVHELQTVAETIERQTAVQQRRSARTLPMLTVKELRALHYLSLHPELSKGQE